MRQLGGAFGINLMVAFFEVRTRFHADALTATQGWDNHTTERLLHQVQQLLQRAGLPFQQQKAGALEYLGTILNINAQSMAFSDTFIVVGAVSLARPDPGRHAVALSSGARAGSPSAEVVMEPKNIVGVWRLASTRATDPDGKPAGVPFGPRGMGLVTLHVGRTHDVRPGRRPRQPARGHAAAILVLLRQLHVRRQHAHHRRRRQLRSRALHRPANPQGALRGRAHGADAARLGDRGREGDARIDLGTDHRPVAAYWTAVRI